ncbi:MAG: DUF4168 domain-containing protein [Rhizonema sp. PD37]|nr:DUF4168 domain-containing protein [Rhizonema sp. PD37]
MKKMNEFYHYFFRHTLSQMRLQTWLLVIITTLGLGSSALLSISKVNAQSSSVSNDEFNSYARAMLSMEPDRQRAFRKIKEILGDRDVPQIVCNDPNSLNNLPSEAHNIAVKYCSRYQQVVEDSGLSIDRFNKITVELQNSSDLKNQIYKILINMQKKL